MYAFTKPALITIHKIQKKGKTDLGLAKYVNINHFCIIYKMKSKISIHKKEI